MLYCVTDTVVSKDRQFWFKVEWKYHFIDIKTEKSYVAFVHMSCSLQGDDVHTLSCKIPN